MDEATPHIHIDFVPFIIGSTRGLDTRVSLKQALGAQGFRGGSRGATEWNQWVQSEKEQLAMVMERYGFEWEQKGTHEQHLSVIDYKKQVRTKELTIVEEKLAEQTAELEAVTKHVGKLSPIAREYDDLDRRLTYSPEYQLPEPATLMTAKSYKTKVADQLVNRLITMLKNLLARFFMLTDSHYQLELENRDLRQDNEYMKEDCAALTEENEILREENRNHALLRKVFGSQKIDDMIEQAKEWQQEEMKTRLHRHEFER